MSGTRGPGRPSPAGFTSPHAALAATEVFAGLDGPSLDRLAGLASTQRYPRGDYLFHRGDPGPSLLVLVSGRVKVLVSSPDGDEVLLSTVGPGQSLGELAVLDGGQRSASVVALEPTTVLTIGRRELLETMAAHPSTLDAVLRALGAMVRRLTDTAGDLVFLDLGGRLAKALLTLTSDGAPTELGLTQSELAAMVGASRQAANRALHAMADRGWLSIEGQRVAVHDIAALRRRAGLVP